MLALKSILQFWIGKDHVHFADDPNDLQRICEKGINLAIYRRKPGSALHRAVQALANSDFKNLGLSIDTSEDYKKILNLHLSKWTFLNLQEIETLVEDIVLFSSIFSQVCKSNSINLYLKSVSDDSCRKFHVDGYAFRLFCCYRGPGTEWTYNNNVNRKYLGLGENEQIIKDQKRIERLEPFDVAILKGELPTLRTGNGIVHRSPPIEEKNEKRLILRLDSEYSE